MEREDPACVMKNKASIYNQSSRWTNLGLAALYGRLDIMRVLLGYRVLPDTTKGRQLAALAKKMDGLPPCQIDEYNGDGYTALCLAAKNSDFDMCKCLLEKGADKCINKPIKMTGETPLAIAIDQGDLTLVNLFLECGANVQTFDNVRSTPLYGAVRLGNAFLVKKLLTYGANPYIGSQDHTPVFLAARLGLTKIAQLLYEAGCDIDVTTAHGITPIHEACIKGQKGMVEYLLSKGCDVNIADDERCSPLYSATQAGHLEICQLLIQAGTELHNLAPDKNPLHLALSNGWSSVAELLLASGLEIGRGVHYKRSIKQMIIGNHRKTAAMLISCCSDLDLSGCLDQHYYGKESECCQNIFWTDFHLLRMLLLSGIKGGNQIVQQMALKEDNSCDEDDDFLKSYLITPLSLQDLSRIRVRLCLGNHVVSKTDSLKNNSIFPPKLKSLVCLEIL